MKQPGKPKNIASRGAKAHEHEGRWVPVPPAYLGDDLDTDVTPFHDMRDTLLQQYEEVFKDEDYKSHLDL